MVACTTLMLEVQPSFQSHKVKMTPSQRKHTPTMVGCFVMHAAQLSGRGWVKNMHDVHTRENCVYANVHYIYIYIRVMSTQSKNWREEGTYACLRVGVGHEGCENLLCTYCCARQKELEQTCLAAFEILVVALVAAARRHLPHLVELPLSGRRVETQADPLWIKSYLLFFQIQCVCVDASPDDRCSLQTIENTFVKSKSY